MTGPELHHIRRVSRVRSGETITLLDGEGGVYTAGVEDLNDSEAVLKVISFEQAERRGSVDIAVGVTKGPRLDMAVEKCSELGARRFLPFTCRRSVWRGDADERIQKRDRLVRKIIAASKQSGQPYFPEVSRVLEFDALAGILSGYRKVFLADCGGGALEDLGGDFEGDAVLGIVGPEGGLSEGEISILLERKAVPLSLGPFRLRSETAAICLLYRLLLEFAAGRR